MNVLYSTNCPKCKILERKLTDLKIPYEVETDVDKMTALGMRSAPNLKVDGSDKILNFNEAIDWIRSKAQEDKN